MTPILRTALGRCQLGVGRADITPPGDAYHRNWGAALHDRAAGIHRPLLATCVALAPLHDHEDVHLLFGLDLGWLREAEMEALLEALTEATGRARHQLVVTFSHTHAAINLDCERSAEPGGEHIRPYLDALPGRCLDAWRQALSCLEPADLNVGVGRCALALERDFRDEERGIYVCGPNPAGDADDTVVVLRATGAPAAGASTTEAGDERLVMANYACHPTTLAWENRLISPDYVGAMRELVEESRSATCLFVQGAAGDLGPAQGFVGDPAVADRNGRQLGHAVLSTLEGMPPPGQQLAYQGPMVSGATVGVWTWQEADASRRLRYFHSECLQVTLPVIDLPSTARVEAEIASWQQRQAAAGDDGEQIRLCRAHVERCRRLLRRIEATPPGRTDIDVTTWLWRVGECVFVMVGGEPYQQLQRNLRRRFPRTPLLLIELCNQSPSYMLPRERYGVGLYQEEVAILAPGCLEALEEAIAARLSTWGLD